MFQKVLAIGEVRNYFNSNHNYKNLFVHIVCQYVLLNVGIQSSAQNSP